MKTKDQLVETALKSEAGFKLAIIDLLADIRNSIIVAILSEEPSTSDTFQDLYDKAVKEMKRVITEEAKDK